MKVKGKVFRADKIKYPDGTGCCIWVPLPKFDKDKLNEADDIDYDCGTCFDFSFKDIEDLKDVLNQLTIVEPEIYVPDEKYEEFEKKLEEKKKKLWWKIYDRLCDISFQFTPFEWRISKLFLRRAIPGPGKEPEIMYRMVWKGFYLGPFCFTW